MTENMTLLSQKEIDTLLHFLIEQKKTVSMEVMDQASIDMLISLLHSDIIKNIRYDTSIPETSDSSAILLLNESESLSGQQNLKLECKVDEKTGYLEIYCTDDKKEKNYRISPQCLEQVRFISDDKSEWGYAVPPVTFDRVAALLKVKYTKKTFDMVCAIYIERMFGDKEEKIPGIYMPAAYDLIRHLAD